VNWQQILLAKTVLLLVLYATIALLFATIFMVLVITALFTVIIKTQFQYSYKNKSFYLLQKLRGSINGFKR